MSYRITEIGDTFQVPNKRFGRQKREHILPLLIGGLVLGAAGLVGKGAQRSKANRELERLQKENPEYKVNPLVAQRFGMAQALLNARTPGAQRAENNIFANQASTIANVNKVATSSADALQAAAATQSLTNEQLDQLAQQEAADYQRRYGNYSQALDQQVEEQNREFADRVRRYNDKVGIQGAITANRANTWGDVSNFGFGIASLGMGANDSSNSTHQQSMALSRMPMSSSKGLSSMTATPKGVSSINAGLIRKPF